MSGSGGEAKILSQHCDGLEVTCSVPQVPLLMRFAAQPGLDADGQPESACLLERDLRRRKKALAEDDPPDWWMWDDGSDREHVRLLETALRPSHAFALETNDWILHVAPSRTVIPRLTFQLRASYLLRVGPLAAFRAVKKWAERQVIAKINGTAPEESPEWKISRLDLAADIGGIEFKPTDLERLTSRAIYRRSYHLDIGSANEHHQGRVFTGFSIGKRGAPIHARIYLKTREAADDASIRDEWERNGYDPTRDGDVWRVEFEIRRKLLRDLERPNEEGLSNDPETNLANDLDDLWNYCTSKWLVLRTEEGSNRMTRRPAEDWWADLARLEGLSRSGRESMPLARRPARPAQADGQLDRALTSLVGYAVTMGTNDFVKVAADLTKFMEEKGGMDAFGRRVVQRRGSTG